jgi:hypothetical protein
MRSVCTHKQWLNSCHLQIGFLNSSLSNCITTPTISEQEGAPGRTGRYKVSSLWTEQTNKVKICAAQPESGLTYCVWESVSGQSTSTSKQWEQLMRVAEINWNLLSIPPRSIEIHLQFWPDQLKSTSDNQMGSVKTLLSCRQRHPTSR